MALQMVILYQQIDSSIGEKDALEDWGKTTGLCDRGLRQRQ